MTVHEWVDIVGKAYGEPVDATTVILWTLVYHHYDPDSTTAEQAAELYMALWRVKERLDRVLVAVDQAGRDAYRT